MESAARRVNIKIWASIRNHRIGRTITLGETLCDDCHVPGFLFLSSFLFLTRLFPICLRFLLSFHSSCLHPSYSKMPFISFLFKTRIFTESGVVGQHMKPHSVKPACCMCASLSLNCSTSNPAPPPGCMPRKAAIDGPSGWALSPLWKTQMGF